MEAGLVNCWVCGKLPAATRFIAPLLYDRRKNVMALDPYTPCPCGSGKKLKFCECAGETAELEKVLNAIDGDQRVAALEQINRVLAQKPTQKAMLALKGIVQVQLGDEAGAKDTVDNFLKVAPTNPVALTLSSLLAAQGGRTDDAVTTLQKAIASSPQEIHYLIPDAILGIAQSLIADGRILAARAHLLLRIAMFGREAEDRPALQLLMQLNRAPDVPLALKQDLAPRDAQGTPPWKAEFDGALDAAANGTWLVAAQRFEALEKQHSNQPDILFNLAVFRTYLGDSSASSLWHRYAHLPGLNLDDAIEAEVLAQELDPLAENDRIDQMRITYAVKDSGRLLEILASDRRMSRMPVDLTTLAEEGSPPPRAAYWLLDREVPASGNALTLETVPRVVGEVLLFGKETDRDSRLEFLVTKTSDLVAKVRKLQEVGGEQLGMIEKEEKIGSTFALDEALVARWRLPEDTPLEIRRVLIEEQYARNMSEVLPKQSIKTLDGRTPREVASDPAYRIRLLGLIRTYELEYQQKRQTADFNELRRTLGLPPQETLDPAGADFEVVSLLRLDRYDYGRMSDDQLVQVVRRASIVSHVEALRRAALAALERNTLAGKFENADAYEILSQIESDLDKALEYNQKAQEAAKQLGRSPARYLLSEFDLRLARRESDHLSRIITQLQTKHMREPGVAEAVYNKLVSLGLINPDGTPRMAGGAPPPSAAAAAPTGGLWTPDAGAAPAAGGEKSKLWIPGMD
jgi:tetratricopeptide (TPR) repeat protein